MVNSKDNLGRTPLSYAAQHRHFNAGVAMLLRRNDLEVDLKDKAGRTPLSYAAEEGDPHSLRLLLDEKEADVNSRDNIGRAPLSYAAGHSLFEDNMAVLLEQADIEVDSKDSAGRTPLSYAAEAGNLYSLQLLLQRDEVDVNSMDKFYRTPLSYAAWQGDFDDGVAILLKRIDIKVDPADDTGSSLVSSAADGGQSGKVSSREGKNGRSL